MGGCCSNTSRVDQPTTIKKNKLTFPPQPGTKFFPHLLTLDHRKFRRGDKKP